MIPFLLVWWMLCYWTSSEQWPRPYDDWKNGLLYMGAGMFCCALLWQRRSDKPAVSRFVVGCGLLYLVAIVLSLTATSSPTYEGLLATARLLLWAALTWSLAHLPLPAWRTIAQWAVGSAALIALLNWGTLHGWSLWQFIPNFHPPIGHITYFGDFMALHFPLAAYLCWTTPRRLHAVGWGMALVAVTMGTLISATRASLVGVVVAGCLVVIVTVWLRLLPWRRLLLISMFGIGMIYIAHAIEPIGLRQYTPLERMRELVTTPFADLTKLSPLRLRAQKITAEMVLQKPWTGWGIGSFRFVYPDFAHRYGQDPYVSATRWFMHPHNEVLHQAVEIGIVGLLAFLGGWGWLYFVGLRQFSQGGSTERGAVLTALAGLTIALVSWQFSTNFLHPLTRLLTAFFAAGLWRVTSCHSVQCEESSSPTTHLAVAIVILGATAFLGTHHVGLYAVRQGQLAKTPDAVQLWSDRARRLAPGSFDAEFGWAATTFYRNGIAETLPTIDHLLNTYPAVPSVLLLAAQARMQSGQPAEAIPLLRRAIANDPGFTAAQQLLDEVTKQP